MLGKKEIKNYDPEVQEKYNGLTDRHRELRAELSAVNSEVDQNLAEIGWIVASGKGYKKHTSRLSELRSQSEALRAGILFVDGQRGLIERMNPWLRSR